jgi:hypothetical protein
MLSQSTTRTCPSPTVITTEPAPQALDRFLLICAFLKDTRHEDD